MALRLVAWVGVLGGVAGFIAYLVVADFAAASWAGIAAIMAAALAWNLGNKGP